MADQEVWVQPMTVTYQMPLPRGTQVLVGPGVPTFKGAMATECEGEPYWFGWYQPDGFPEGYYLAPRRVGDAR